MILGTITFLMEKAVQPSKTSKFLMEKWVSRTLTGQISPRSVVLVSGKIWGLQHSTSLRSPILRIPFLDRGILRHRLIELSM